MYLFIISVVVVVVIIIIILRPTRQTAKQAHRH